MKLKIKRVYDAPEADDGQRILVDRLWPRGLTKEKAAIDLWIRDIAPSTELRQWFGHDPSKWSQFQTKFRSELDANSEVVAKLRELIASKPSTLVYAAHDEEHNNAVVIRDYLLD